MKGIYIHKIRTLFAAVCFFLCTRGYALSEGSRLFMLNKPEAAIPVLEKELQLPDADPSLYIYLGISYYQTGKYEHALDVFEKGMKVRGADIYMLNLNAGNTAFAMKNYTLSVSYYQKAIDQGPDKPAPVLNRGNAFVKLDRLTEALSDYKKFIEMAPQDPQSAKVAELIQLIEEELERRRIETEKNAAKTELLAADEATPVFPEPEYAGSEPVDEADKLKYTPPAEPPHEPVPADVGTLKAEDVRTAMSEKIADDRKEEPPVFTMKQAKTSGQKIETVDRMVPESAAEKPAAPVQHAASEKVAAESVPGAQSARTAGKAAAPSATGEPVDILNLLKEDTPAKPKVSIPAPKAAASDATPEKIKSVANELIQSK